MAKDIVLEIWGNFACFTRPECKVERLSYPIPTPSAIRGVLNAIYNKPEEFYWQVKKIEVLKPIKFISFKRNEVKGKIDTQFNVIYADSTDEKDKSKGRTQRQTTMLKDVWYRVTANIEILQKGKITENQIYEQSIRRIESGKCYYQPYLGTRECIAYFGTKRPAYRPLGTQTKESIEDFCEKDKNQSPINESLDVGLMLYDVFDITKYTKPKDVKPFITLFKAKMNNGIIDIPKFNDDSVIKPTRRV